VNEKAIKDRTQSRLRGRNERTEEAAASHDRTPCRLLGVGMVSKRKGNRAPHTCARNPETSGGGGPRQPQAPYQWACDAHSTRPSEYTTSRRRGAYTRHSPEAERGPKLPPRPQGKGWLGV